ncbi:MAG: hypothetical protein DMG65_00335 [Candidatus Angelobacter sp. Gp1-AA117]|nr:MAG: hypothetical protein DMG65_00335 [Candidatus Angelobacter sp. Gp1-AA117]
MSVITITLTTYDRSRCAEVTLPDSLTVGALLDQCRKRWQLDSAEIFAVRHVQRNARLSENDSLSTSGVVTGMELQIFPLVEGGCR